jgi:hypothetical protein
VSCARLPSEHKSNASQRESGEADRYKPPGRYRRSPVKEIPDEIHERSNDQYPSPNKDERQPATHRFWIIQAVRHVVDSIGQWVSTADS